MVSTGENAANPRVGSRRKRLRPARGATRRGGAKPRGRNRNPRAWLPSAEEPAARVPAIPIHIGGRTGPVGSVLWEWTRAVSLSRLRDERRELREGIRLSGGEPFGWSTEGRKTPGVPRGASGANPRRGRSRRVRTLIGPGTREGLWRGARGQEGRGPVERREAGDRALERSGRPRGPVARQPVNPDAARQGRGGSEQRPTSSLRVASRMEFCWATCGTVRDLEARVNPMRAGRKAEPRDSRDSAGA